MGFGDNSYETGLRRYDPEIDEWANLEYQGPTRLNFYIDFSLGGKVYIGGGYGSALMWMYDPAFTP